MNNYSIREGVNVGEWISKEGLEVEKAFLWPYQPQIAEDIKIAGDVDKVVGVDPKGFPNRTRNKEGIESGHVESHQYTGQRFDFEYGWAIADDTINALESQIEPEENLQMYEYSNPVETDQALNRAFSRITNTTNRLLEDENATVVYSMASTNRYKLPNLSEDPVDNQEEYAKRVSGHLEELGFETELMYNPDVSKHFYVSGKR